MEKKTVTTLIMSEEEINKAEKACKLIAETISVNNIEENIAIRAMSSLLVGMLAHLDDDIHFYVTMKGMDSAFCAIKELLGRKV